MDRRTVFSKTAKGLMEATGKTSVLSRDLRALLKEIDGKATVGEVQTKFGKVPEAKLQEALNALAEDLPFSQIQSVVPGVAWPALPAPGGAAVLALLFQLERSQWLPLDQLRERQLQQLELLLQHALATVPYYRERWGAGYDPALPLTLERFAALPLLTRRELQEQFENLKSGKVPPGHGGIKESQSSGSTGTPVRILKTQLSGLFWNAFTLRDHWWHRRDLRGKLATIRHGIPAGEFDHWGQATDGLLADADRPFSAWVTACKLSFGGWNSSNPSI